MNRRDILLEMSELCQESLDFIHNQLIYYRASVYKQESAEIIQREIETLKMISSLLPQHPLEEAISDYDAETRSSHPPPFPGECLFSTRVVRLLDRLRAELKDTCRNVQAEHSENCAGQEPLSRKLGENKQNILSRARPGSRAWSFFQNYQRAGN